MGGLDRSSLMRHVSLETLMNCIDGSASEAERSAAETHVMNCKDCADQKQEFQVLVARLREDSAFEPPANALNYSIDLFQPVIRPDRTKVRQFIASLVFDTFDQPLVAGMRRVGTPPRQLLFRAGDVDVDVKIESMEANDRISLAGQVLSSSPKFFDNTPVNLESHGIVGYRTRTN